MLENLSDRDTCVHTFSPEFEKNMKKVLKRAKHPVRYQLLKTVAAVLFIMVLGASTVLTISTEARERLFGWMNEQYFSLTSYNIAYANNETAKILQFSYMFPNEDSSMYIDTKGSVKENVKVGSNEADIYLFEDGVKGNGIVWVDQK